MSGFTKTAGNTREVFSRILVKSDGKLTVDVRASGLFRGSLRKSSPFGGSEEFGAEPVSLRAFFAPF